MVGIDPLTKRRRNGILIPRNTPLPVTAKRTFSTHKAGQRSIRVQDRRGREPRGRRLHAVGHCTVRTCRRTCPPSTPVEVRFPLRAQRPAEGPGAPCPAPTQMATEIVRENSLSKEHMDGWRQYICGKPPTEYR